MDCEFCKKNFSSKSNLLTHQKTAKFCLNLQGKENKDFVCKDCSRTFTANKILVDHIQVCKERLRREKDSKETEYIKTVRKLELKIKENEYLKEKLQEKTEYITKLENKLDKMEASLNSKLEKMEDVMSTIALESKTKAITTNSNNTTNNITVTHNNVLNLSQEHVKKILTEIDYNVVYAGQAGLAKFVVDNMLTDESGKIIYKCVDPSRQMFEFIDENGAIVRDMKAEKLIQSLLNGDVIKIGLNEASKGWNTEDKNLNTERSTVFGPKVSEYANLNRNNTVFRSKVSSLTT